MQHFRQMKNYLWFQIFALGIFINIKLSGDLGNLLTKYQKLEEKHARFYISEILLALEALHKQSIIFRDLKPDNVVLDERGRIIFK